MCLCCSIDLKRLSSVKLAESGFNRWEESKHRLIAWENKPNSCASIHADNDFQKCMLFVLYPIIVLILIQIIWGLFFILPTCLNNKSTISPSSTWFPPQPSDCRYVQSAQSLLSWKSRSPNPAASSDMWGLNANKTINIRYSWYKSDSRVLPKCAVRHVFSFNIWFTEGVCVILVRCHWESYPKKTWKKPSRLTCFCCERGAWAL